MSIDHDPEVAERLRLMTEEGDESTRRLISEVYAFPEGHGPLRPLRLPSAEMSRPAVERLRRRLREGPRRPAAAHVAHGVLGEDHPEVLTELLDALRLRPGEARDRVGFSLGNCGGVTLQLVHDTVTAMRAELDAARAPVAALLGDGVRSVTSAGERLHIVTDDGIRVCLRVTVESAVKS